MEYKSYEDFKSALLYLTQTPSFGRAVGERGRRFVRANYAWPVVERKYLECVERVCRKAA
jgi:hypothetical protein